MKRIASIVLSFLIFLLFAAGARAGEPLPAGPNTGSAGVQWRAQWGGAARALAYEGGRAFIAVGPRLLAADVSDATAPQLQGAAPPLSETIQDVALSAQGQYSYVAAGYGGLLVYDVTGSVPVVAAGLHPGGYVAAVVPAGTHLFAADLGGRLLKIDVAVPTRPALDGAVENVGQIAGVAAAGDVVFVATGYGGLKVYDSATLALLTAVPQPAWSVSVVDDVAVVGSGFTGGVQLYDVADPAHPVARGSVPTAAFVTGAAAAGEMLYLAVEGGAIHIIDVTEPGLPQEVGVMQLGGSLTDLASDGNRLLALRESSGLALFEVPAGGVPRLEGVVETTGPILAVDVAEEVSLLGTGGGELVIATGAEGVILSRFPLPAPLLGMARTGKHAVLALGEAGLMVVDLTDPAHPLEAAAVPSPGAARRVAVEDGMAYVAAGPAGLLIYRVATPSSPELVAALSLAGDARDVVVRDGMAYVADWSGLQLVDVSDPIRPEAIGRFDTTGYAAAVALFGELAYVADGQRVDIIDVSRSQRLEKVGQIVTPGLAGDVDILSDLLAVADGASGARLYRLGNGVDLEPAGYYDTPGFTTGVTLQSDTLWMADREGGVTVVSVPTRHTLFLPVVVR